MTNLPWAIWTLGSVIISQISQSFSSPPLFPLYLQYLSQIHTAANFFNHYLITQLGSELIALFRSILWYLGTCHIHFIYIMKTKTGFSSKRKFNVLFMFPQKTSIPCVNLISRTVELHGSTHQITDSLKITALKEVFYLLCSSSICKSNPPGLISPIKCHVWNCLTYLTRLLV